MSLKLYTPELAKRVCDAISTSAEGIKAICAGEGMPDDTTVYHWIHQYPEFRTMYEAARAAQQDHRITECLDIADSADVNDWQVAKLRIDQRRWEASKLAPKRYGDKITHSGDSDAPLVTNPSADALIAFLLQKGATETEIRRFISSGEVIEHEKSGKL